MATETPGRTIVKRRRVKQTTPLEERIARRIEELKARAEQLPTGPQREKELRKIAAMTAGSELNFGRME